MSANLYLGIDLGGTKVAVGLVDAHGKVIRKVIAPTFPDGKEKASIHALAKQLAALALSLVDKRDLKHVRSLGIASAGPMDIQKGILLSPTHFPGWKKVPLVSSVKAALQKCGSSMPIYFQNDAMAAALGEGWVGAARGLETYVVITVGTGIGSGMIYRGSPAQFNGMGGEWGLGITSLENARNQKDAWAGSTEAFASGTGIIRRAKSMGFRGKNLTDLIATNEKKYIALFDDTAFALAVLCHNLSLGFHPQAILFTGGVMQFSEYFFPKLQKHYKQLLVKNPKFRAPLRMAKLGNAAGMVGAARLGVLAK